MSEFLKSNIFESSFNFNETALELFHFQIEQVAVYKSFVDLLGVDVSKIDAIDKIPFLPIEFFKTHTILADGYNSEITFSSSGTSGMQTSKHYVHDVKLYEQSFIKGFEHFYGNISDYCFLCLLPSYLERSGSSLIYMAEKLISFSAHLQSGFYLNEFDTLYNNLIILKQKKQKTILIGVTFALLDFAEYLKTKNDFSFDELIIMETGGMKGRREEMIREELHHTLCKSFGSKSIHSEYGMTELLSQSYSKANGIFQSPPWQKILIRDINDATSLLNEGKAGGINVIDLANFYSCAFIATQDLGRCHNQGSFEVIGRFDNSDLRGCNLLIA